MSCVCGRELSGDYKFGVCGVCRSFERLLKGRLEGDV